MATLSKCNTPQWVFQQFNGEKICHSERYRRTIKHKKSVCTFFPTTLESSSSHDTKKSSVVFIPDGPFLRKYLTLIEEIISNYSSFDELNQIKLILLESAAESMDYRNSSPCVLSGTESSSARDEFKCSSNCIDKKSFVEKETAAINERNRIVKLAFENKQDNAYSGVEVIPFPDLTVKNKSDETQYDQTVNDDFDIFHFTSMNVENRSKCALVRAANFFYQAAKKELKVIMNSSDNMRKNQGTVHIILLSEDEVSLNREKHGNSAFLKDVDIGGMNSHDLVVYLTNSCSLNGDETQMKLLKEHWINLRKRCEDEYIRRNQPHERKTESTHSCQMDRYGHFEHLHQDILQEGIKQKKFFKGKLKVTEENCKEAYCNVKGPKGENLMYYVNEKNGHFNRTIHNDLVVIEPFPQSEWEVPVGRRRLVHLGHEEQESAINKSSLAEIDLDVNKSNLVPTARVVGLVDSTSNIRRQFVATLLPKITPLRDENAIIVIPMDNKIPKIRMKTRIDYDKIANKRLLVEIDAWNVDSMYPSGHYVKILGDVGDLETEISCLLIEHGVDLSPFSANALACLPFVRNELQWKVSNEEVKKRRDLRQCCRIFSVDPQGCQDIDDAMHARVLKTGDIEIGVHIADVTHFVKLNSALDKEAAKRGTTFYLVDRRFDMLPSLLSSNLCSLHGNADRYAVSVLWTLSPDLESIKSTWYGRTVIHNVQAMTYEQAHNILHNQEPDDLEANPPLPLTAGAPVDRSIVKYLKKDLQILTRLARKLRHRRETIGGAVDLSSGDRGSELKFELDSNGRPTKVKPKKELEIHHTIAELMIMSNAFVAETIYNRFPDSSILRIHKPANTDSFQELGNFLKASGLAFDSSSNKALAQTLKDAKAKQNSAQDSLFQSLATRAMSEAQYVCTGTLKEGAGLSHYGLGIDMYCHFTSPIRRYADIAVHHLLLASIVPIEERNHLSYTKSTHEMKSLPTKSNAISILSGDGLHSVGKASNHSGIGVHLENEHFLDSLIEGAAELTLNLDDQHNGEDRNIEEGHLYKTTELSIICNHLNAQNRAAKSCSMECQRLFLSLYFRKNIEVTQAVVIDLRQNGLVVYVPKFDMKGPIYLSDLNGCVQIVPSMLNLPSTSGLPSTAGFSIVEGCRMFPEGVCKIHQADSRLEIIIPGSPKQLVFKRLDVITIQVSCDLTSSTARIPAPRLHLLSLHTKKQRNISQNVHEIATMADSRVSSPDKLKIIGKNNFTSKSMFQMISSIPLKSIIDEIPFRCSSMRKKVTVGERVQTIKGRLHFGGFKDKTNIDERTIIDDRKGLKLEDHAKSGDYDASRRIEREATSRIQRKAAEKRNARRTKKK